MIGDLNKMDIPDKFWSEWENSIDKREKIKQLAFKEYIGMIKKHIPENKELCKAMELSFYSLLNSYFEDLRDYCFSWGSGGYNLCNNKHCVHHFKGQCLTYKQYFLRCDVKVKPEVKR